MIQTVVLTCLTPFSQVKAEFCCIYKPTRNCLLRQIYTHCSAVVGGLKTHAVIGEEASCWYNGDCWSLPFWSAFQTAKIPDYMVEKKDWHNWFLAKWQQLFLKDCRYMYINSINQVEELNKNQINLYTEDVIFKTDFKFQYTKLIRQHTYSSKRAKK